MFRGYDANNPTRDQVDIQLQAHGGSIVLIQRDKHGGPFRYRQRRTSTSTSPISMPSRTPRSRPGTSATSSTGASERKWERYHDRFDLAKEPHEPFRFGWVVEIDPYDPDFTPRKHTSLGRLKHECGTTTLTKSNRVAVYTGDDERFEYFHKFVTKGKYRWWDASTTWACWRRAPCTWPSCATTAPAGGSSWSTARGRSRPPTASPAGPRC
jgi:secreted PhoX family phosphatase